MAPWKMLEDNRCAVLPHAPRCWLYASLFAFSYRLQFEIFFKAVTENGTLSNFLPIHLSIDLPAHLYDLQMMLRFLHELPLSSCVFPKRGKEIEMKIENEQAVCRGKNPFFLNKDMYCRSETVRITLYIKDRRRSSRRHVFGAVVFIFISND